eukprot:scaffold6790_cov99-Isochrysis_galbana.AAC.3
MFRPRCARPRRGARCARPPRCAAMLRPVAQRQLQRSPCPQRHPIFRRGARADLQPQCPCRRLAVAQSRERGAVPIARAIAAGDARGQDAPHVCPLSPPSPPREPAQSPPCAPCPAHELHAPPRRRAPPSRRLHRRRPV